MTNRNPDTDAKMLPVNIFLDLYYSIVWLLNLITSCEGVLLMSWEAYGICEYMHNIFFYLKLVGFKIANQAHTAT